MLWGCIADDITGATDLATNLVSRGLRTTLVFGPVDATVRRTILDADADALVVALKSRTAPVHDAVAQSVAATDALHAAGAERFYFKYCSTFDSTPRGNIGPVLDALLQLLGERVTIVAPSFPDAGRTVYQGYLFVGDELLSESPMRHHPLTPMTDSSVPRLLRAQSSSAVRRMSLATVRLGADAVRSALHARSERPTAVVVDAIDNADLARIMAGSADLRLVTGGSGLALGLPQRATAGTRDIPVVPGRRLVLSGSASERTREQVRRAKELAPWLKLDVTALRSDFDAEVRRVRTWLDSVWVHDDHAAPLVYSVDSLEDVEQGTDASELVERALSAVAGWAVEAGATKIIVAGGESSGEVIAGLGVHMLRIGPEIDPGVAWAAAATRRGRVIDIALKSGNFGRPSMFTDAWDVLGERSAVQ